jgi:hypothetical protein
MSCSSYSVSVILGAEPSLNNLSKIRGPPQLLVEQFFRAAKSLLHTRPVFHQWDATIKGHVFCSFLALVLFDELKRRAKERGCDLEWNDIRHDLQSLSEVEVKEETDTYLLRTPLHGVAGKVLQAVGVAIPPPVRAAA